jgi:hypothetical protein
MFKQAEKEEMRVKLCYGQGVKNSKDIFKI